MAKALIIDDVKFIYANLKNILSEIKIDSFDFISDVKRAVNIYKNNEQDVDIIFLSASIPACDEYENSIAIIKFLKSIDPYIRIVMIKSSSDQQTVLKALQAGATDFIEKPFDKEEIKRVLKKLNV